MWIGFGLWIHVGFVGLIAISVAVLLWSEFAFRKRLQIALSGKGYIQLTLIAQNDVYALNRTLDNEH